MKPATVIQRQQGHIDAVIVDMSDCYTWSFPEFLPFCAKLYYFSSLKDFKGDC